MRSRERSTSSTCTISSSPTCTTEVGWSKCVSPQLRHVDEAVHPAEVDELDEVDDQLDDAFGDLTGLEVGEELVVLLSAGSLPGRRGRNSTTLLRFLSSSMILHSSVAPDERVQIADPAQVDE